MNYQAAVATAAAVARAQTATAGASVLEPLAGRGLTYGTWAVRAAAGFGEIAVAGAGASVAGLLTGMMPGRLNDGEQDFIDRMRAEQMREAPTRVRFTWENDGKGNPTPRGWHTPPGKDMVRVRKMEWDSRYQAYTFTTEEEPRITIIWTPDHSGVNTPSNTGNQARPVLPNPVIVDPLADNTGITATTTPAPEEKSFADYILILPAPDLPPIYIYIRNNPGQVTGKGQKVSGIWLKDAD
jgi:pyocin large subunit-like protein